MTLDHGQRTPPHGDALLALRAEARLTFRVVSVPLLPGLEDLCDAAAVAWHDDALEGLSPFGRLLADVKVELDTRRIIDLEAPTRIVVAEDLGANVRDGHVWGVPVRVDPTLAPGDWRLESVPHAAAR
jgi:hypothetical protein